jgi:prophage antirepressor-like protein
LWGKFVNSLVSFDFSQKSVRVVLIDGNPWFVAVDVCRVLELNNTSQALVGLDEDEKGVTTADTLGGPQKLSIINESGMYSLVLTSRKPEAKRFKKWITSEVLPTIRKTGSFSFGNMPAMANHTRRSIQVGHSKDINQVMMERGGRDAIVSYNTKNCVVQSGRLPKEWKTLGKDAGLSSRQCASAKDVLRVKEPQVACGMSLADQMVVGGVSVEDGISIGKESQALFRRMLEVGFTPPELLL